MSVVLKLKRYVSSMIDAFTLRFLLLLLIVQGCLNGIVYMTINSSMFPLFKSIGVTGSQVQILTTLAMAPWSLKPIMGMLSDFVPIGRYNKRYWMLLACVVGIAGSAALVANILVPSVLVFLFFCIHYQISNCDLLIEGKYAELMEKAPQTGSNVVVLKMGVQQLGFIIALSFVGPLSDEGTFVPMYIISLCFVILPFFPIAAGWLPEERLVPTNPRCTLVMVDRHKLRQNWKMLVFVVVIGCTGPIVSLLMAFSPFSSVEITRVVCLSFAVAVLLVAIVGGYWAFPRIIGHVALYQVITSLSRMSVNSALDFFYTADPVCLPNGPHFTYKYYILVSGTLGTIFSFASVFLYQYWLSSWRFRSALLLTTGLSIFAGLFDLFMVLRWNLVLGIPDKYFYIVGEAILEQVIGMLYWIPSSTIIAKACPKGMEASTYAFLAGVSNFASTISSLTGAMAIDWAGLQTSGSSCNWANLWILVLVGHIAGPLLINIPASFLIPNTKQTEPLESTDNRASDNIELDDFMLVESSADEVDF